MQRMKRNLVIAAVLVFVCAAVYFNWSYNNKWGTQDGEMVSAEDDAMAEANEQYPEQGGQESAGQEDEEISAVSEYFATARLTRQQSRDEALSLLEMAASSAGASQEVIDSAMNEISSMAVWSMQENQLENLLLAKEFAECVVFISGDSITVAVPAPLEGLTEASVARITETIVSQTDFSADQIRVIGVADEQ